MHNFEITVDNRQNPVHYVDKCRICEGKDWLKILCSIYERCVPFTIFCVRFTKKQFDWTSFCNRTHLQNLHDVVTIWSSGWGDGDGHMGVYCGFGVKLHLASVYAILTVTAYKR